MHIMLYNVYREENVVMSRQRLLTVQDAAGLLGVNPETLRRWDNSGKFKARRHPINNYRLYSLKEVETLKRKIQG